MHRNRPPQHERIECFAGGLNDEDATRRLVEGCDAVVHAGLARGSKSFIAVPEDPVGYYETNVVGSLRLIEAAVKAGVERFVIVSSGAVHATVLTDRPLDESHPMLPNTLYGATKAAVENLAHAYAATSKLQIANLRPVAIYGVDHPVERSRWYETIASAVAGGTVDIQGGGKVVHTSDVARAVTHLLDTDSNIAGQTYNCCQRFVSFAEIAEIVSKVLGRAVKTSGQPKEVGNEMQTSRLKELGFQFSGDECLRQTIETIVQKIAA
ncbi:MAG: NAD(P)-dependent oxidoreductase [Planctomycetota bacterium]